MYVDALEELFVIFNSATGQPYSFDVHLAISTSSSGAFFFPESEPLDCSVSELPESVVPDVSPLATRAKRDADNPMARTTFLSDFIPNYYHNGKTPFYSKTHNPGSAYLMAAHLISRGSTIIEPIQGPRNQSGQMGHNRATRIGQEITLRLD
jgi:hypothetical protein